MYVKIKGHVGIKVVRDFLNTACLLFMTTSKDSQSVVTPNSISNIRRLVLFTQSFFGDRFLKY